MPLLSHYILGIGEAALRTCGKKVKDGGSPTITFWDILFQIKIFFIRFVAISCAAFTATTWVAESKNDYDVWIASRRDRERNIPEILLPKTIFDWSEFNRTENKNN